jgi:dTDP-4-amino-4,6-dideoxygalactose transaminase
VFEALRAQGIHAQVHYIPVPTQPWYRDRFGYRMEAFPQAENYYAGCMSLPLFPLMNDGDVERVAGALRQILTRETV